MYMQTYHSLARDAFAYTGVDDVERLVVVAFKGSYGRFRCKFCSDGLFAVMNSHPPFTTPYISFPP